MATQTTKTDRIRCAVVEWMCDAEDIDTATFTARDVREAIGDFLRKEVGDSKDLEALVGAALSSWSDKRMVIRGHRLKTMTRPGQVRRYLLQPVRRTKPKVQTSGDDGQVQATAVSEPLDRFAAGLAGQYFTGEIVEAKPDGSMLVRAHNGSLYTVKKLNW
jgi:hypothetical protein